MNPKLLVICGPTATGKTKLAVKLAKKFNGEIISADSRQVYKDMDIVTGKDLPKGAKLKKNYYLFNNIPIWGLDLINPNQDFSVAHYQKFAQKIIQEISNKEKLPLLVGGTGFYIKAIIEKIDTLGIPPDKNLRKKLENYSLIQLQKYLQKLNSPHFNKLNRSDKHNPRRLVRAIEITLHQPASPCPAGRRVAGGLSTISNQQSAIKIMDIFIIGLTAPYKNLYKNIDQRVDKRIKMGAEKEIKHLLKKGYSWQLPSMSALGYCQWKPYFQGRTTKNEVIQKWKFAEHAYARRQLTYFKKFKKIHWFDISQKTLREKVEKKVTSWYTDSDAQKS